MAKLLKTNPDNKEFIRAIRKLEEGDRLEVEDGTLEVEGKFTIPTHFPFHQRIFAPGMILHKLGTNVRIYIEAEKLKMDIDPFEDGEFDDRQKDEAGKVLPADPDTQFSEERHGEK